MSTSPIPLNILPFPLAQPSFQPDLAWGAGSNSLLVSIPSYAGGTPYGTCFYITISATNPDRLTGEMSIFKSVDGGNTWILTQSTTRSYTGGFTKLAVAFSRQGRLIIAAVRASDLRLVILTYQLSTDSFLADDTSGPLSGGTDDIGLVVWSNHLALAIGYDSSGNLAAATEGWSAPSTICAVGNNPNGVACIATNSTVGSANTAYVFYISQPATHFIVSVQVITSNLNLGASAQIADLTVLGSPSEWGPGPWNMGFASSGSIIAVPILGNSGNGTLTVYRQTGGVTFAADTLLDGTQAFQVGCNFLTATTTCGIINLNGTLYCLYLATTPGTRFGSITDTTFPIQTYLYYQTSSGNGVWSPPVLAWTSSPDRAASPVLLYPAIIQPGPSQPFSGTPTQGATAGLLLGTFNPYNYLGADQFAKLINLFTGGSLVSPANPGLLGAPPSAGPVGIGGAGGGPGMVATPWLLRRLVVAMKPEKHLPVRGAAQ